MAQYFKIRSVLRPQLPAQSTTIALTAALRTAKTQLTETQLALSKKSEEVTAYQAQIREFEFQDLRFKLELQAQSNALKDKIQQKILVIHQKDLEICRLNGIIGRQEVEIRYLREDVLTNDTIN